MKKFCRIFVQNFSTYTQVYTVLSFYDSFIPRESSYFQNWLNYCLLFFALCSEKLVCFELWISRLHASLHCGKLSIVIFSSHLLPFKFHTTKFRCHSHETDLKFCYFLGWHLSLQNKWPDTKWAGLVQILIFLSHIMSALSLSHTRTHVHTTHTHKYTHTHVHAHTTHTRTIARTHWQICNCANCNQLVLNGLQCLAFHDIIK